MASLPRSVVHDMETREPDPRRVTPVKARYVLNGRRRWLQQKLDEARMAGRPHTFYVEEIEVVDWVLELIEERVHERKLAEALLSEG